MSFSLSDSLTLTRRRQNRLEFRDSGDFGFFGLLDFWTLLYSYIIHEYILGNYEVRTYRTGIYGIEFLNLNSQNFIISKIGKSKPKSINRISALAHTVEYHFTRASA